MTTRTDYRRAQIDGAIPRRYFIQLSMTAAASVLSWLAAESQAAGKDCRPALTHSEQVLNALADTFIPNEEDSPGAVEACALEVILNPSYRFSLSLPVVITGLDGLAVLRYGRSFIELTLAQRTAIVEFKFRVPVEREIYALALVLTRLSYYGAVRSDVGIRSFGYPGPSTGYSCSYSYNLDPHTDERRLVRGNFN
ncbi:MAG: hypothetical protein HYR55_15100 [Acidobacteria bacterium]|nr:hypothetical protein [Acidobacteriota bacterium]MBI3657666.1 hypothetical protein [Acidobacteriota bacterium]